MSVSTLGIKRPHCNESPIVTAGVPDSRPGTEHRGAECPSAHQNDTLSAHCVCSETSRRSLSECQAHLENLKIFLNLENPLIFCHKFTCSPQRTTALLANPHSSSSDSNSFIVTIRMSSRDCFWGRWIFELSEFENFNLKWWFELWFPNSQFLSLSVDSNRRIDYSITA